MTDSPVAVNVSAPIPASIPQGVYAVYLNLPDPATSIRDRPEYSIRLANKDVWEEATGYNSLLHTVNITDAPWLPLLNGRDLGGWKVVALTNPAPAVVEDGAIVLRQRVNTVEHTFLASDREYDDFILELDLKDDPGFNSGILLRCVEASAGARVRLNGYQVKIDNTPRAWTGGIFDDFGDSWRWLHDLADNEVGRAAFKLGEWARFRIECIGASIKVWVNGVPTCHLVDEKYSKGAIAFKIHSMGDSRLAGENAIRLRNIRIITEHPERYARPTELPPRRAPTVPGKFDKARVDS
jgi:hypothetical protein